jgi:hypothetical protein
MTIVNPFAPIERADAVIIDGRVRNETVKKLNSMGIQVIKTIKCDDVYEAISYHPDICIHPIDNSTLVVAPNVFEYYSYIFKNTSIKLIKGEKVLKSNYPYNVAYNVARVSRYAIHNFRYTDEKLLYYLKKKGIELINVKQGYSKCSVSIVNNNAMMTSDPSIFKRCSGYDIDILFIDAGYIELPGFDYGFIGGATGCISKNEFLFTGEYNNHPSRDKINQFLSKYGKKPIILSSKKIIDIGSIIPLKYI